MEFKTKLNIEDEIFFIDRKKVIQSIVKGIKIEVVVGELEEITYLCGKETSDRKIYIKVSQEDAFKTKQELLKSL